MKYILLAFLCLIFISVEGQDTINVTIDLTTSKIDAVSVSIYPEFKEENYSPTVFFFRPRSGSNKVILNDFNVEHNTKFSENDYKSWWVKDIGEIKEISYSLTSINHQSSTKPPLVKIINKEFYQLQLSACIPEFLLPEECVIALSVKFDENLYSPQINANETRYFNNFYSLLSETLVIGSFQRFVLKTEQGYDYDLFYFTDNKDFLHYYLEDIISPVLTDLVDYIKPIEPINNRIVLCNFKNAGNSSHGFWGGAFNNDFTLITLPSIKSKSRFKELLYETLAHEYIHQLVPFLLFTDKTFQPISTSQKYSKHLWLYEGVVEYLSWHFLVEKEYISIRSFQDHFGKKIRKGNKERTNLTTLSEQIHLPKNGNKVNYFYNKGAAIAFLTDILINEKWAGQKNLLFVIQELINEDRVFSDDNFINHFEAKAGAQIGTFLRKVLMQANFLKPNNILSKIGWKYKELSEEEVPTFGVFNVRPNFKKPYLTIVNARRNELGFLNGDAINAVNGKELTIQNGDTLLKQLTRPEAEKEVFVDVIRNGELVELNSLPSSMITTFRNVIREDKPIDKATQLLKWVFN